MLYLSLPLNMNHYVSEIFKLIIRLQHINRDLPVIDMRCLLSMAHLKVLLADRL